MAKDIENEETKEQEETEVSSDSTEQDEENEETSGDDETDETEDSDETEEDLSAEDLKTAKQLLKQLRNGETAKDTVLALAKTLGVKLEGEKKKESEDGTPTKITKKERKELEKIIEEHMPSQWGPLKTVLRKILEEYNEHYVEPVQSQYSEEKHLERSEAARDWARDKWSDFDSLGEEMVEIANKIAPAKLSNLKDYKDYVEKIYYLAKAGKGGGNEDLTKRLSKIVEKTTKNAKRAKPGPSDVTNTKGDVKIDNIQDAIRLAEKQLRMKK